METSTPAHPTLRMPVDEFYHRIEAGEPALIIDVRNPKVWGSSDTKIRGAIRIDPAHFTPSPAWPKDRLIGLY